MDWIALALGLAVVFAYWFALEPMRRRLPDDMSGLSSQTDRRNRVLRFRVKFGLLFAALLFVGGAGGGLAGWLRTCVADRTGFLETAAMLLALAVLSVAAGQGVAAYWIVRARSVATQVADESRLREPRVQQARRRLLPVLVGSGVFVVATVAALGFSGVIPREVAGAVVAGVMVGAVALGVLLHRSVDGGGFG